MSAVSPTVPPLPPLALYVHFPWCVRKCPYCDFNSHALQPNKPPHASTAMSSAASGIPLELEQRYLAALEADLLQALPSIWGRRIVSVFIGGGTPSMVSPEAIALLLSRLRALLPLLPDAEVTLEANPGTFEAGRFRAYAQAGVTRLSLGVQSFDDVLLQRLGRIHSAEQAHAAAAVAAQCFAQWNLDLMYALPGQSMDQLQRDVDQALALAPPHVSIYHLTLEPNTVFYSKPPPALPDDDTAYAMQDTIMAATADAGLTRYEVSAFAMPGAQCQHNLNYWQFGDYLGIGAGAHSKISHLSTEPQHALQPLRVTRSQRLREPEQYMQAASAQRAVSQSQEVASSDLAGEYMMNALRLVQGFELADFSQRTGLTVTRIAQALTMAEHKGWLARDLARVWPTTRGLDFLSDLCCLFLD